MKTINTVQMVHVTVVDINEFFDSIPNWVGDISYRVGIVGLIVVGTAIALWFLRVFVNHIVASVIESQTVNDRDARQRADTISRIIASTGRVVILVVAIIMILTNIGLNVTPLLASAGIVGLAIAFGAQSLIKDAFHGFFVLLEDQYAVGDFVQISGMTGTVEELSLRRTVLRGADGAAITVPNGEVRTVENYSKEWARAIVDVDVGPDADDQQVMDVFHQVLDDIQSDPEIGKQILEPPTIIGITNITANRMTFRATIMTEPSAQWSIGRELRRRVRNALIARGVAMPPRTLDIIGPEA